MLLHAVIEKNKNKKTTHTRSFILVFHFLSIAVTSVRGNLFDRHDSVVVVNVAVVNCRVSMPLLGVIVLFFLLLLSFYLSPVPSFHLAADLLSSCLH